MIATITYTEAFFKNLSQFRLKQEDAPKPREIEPSPKPQVNKDDLFLDYNKGSDYEEQPEPQKKVLVEEDEDYKKKRPLASVGGLQYEPRTWSLTQHPELSNEISETRRLIDEEKAIQAQLLAIESKSLQNLKKIEEEFRQTLLSKDIRAKTASVCKNQQAELLACIQKQGECSELLSLWKKCELGLK
mmetsp:Transcript_27525/g.49628  ORF Transcript_27525/g.49628 Transcript_27525/m.49628 type:complete len:188 (-) Transcript_27525:27-590(-)